MKANYKLKEIIWILEHPEGKGQAGILAGRMEREGIPSLWPAWEKFRPGREKAAGEKAPAPPAGGRAREAAGALYVSDCGALLRSLQAEGCPVLGYSHPGNRKEAFPGIPYVMEGAGEVEPEYLERVYRRFAGIPWDILETERCLVREMGVEDVPALCALYGDPAAAAWTDPPFSQESWGRAYVREYAQKVYAYLEFGIWTVVLKETGEVIGRAGIMPGQGEIPELGYLIGAPWQRRGLGSEVCRAILDYARGELGFAGVRAVIHRDNIPSLALARRLGFHPEGETAGDKLSLLWGQGQDPVISLRKEPSGIGRAPLDSHSRSSR